MRRHVSLTALLMFMTLILSSCARDPQKAKAQYLASGRDYMRNGHYGDAAIEFRNALRLDPRFVEAYYELARADLAQHDWSSAYASLEKAIELDPGRLDARLDRGRLYLAARQFDRAEDEGNFILQRDPKDIGAYQLLVAAFMGEHKPDQALVAASRVIALLPNNPSAYVNVALVEISLNHSADAERDLKTALAVDPKALQAYTDLANFYRLEERIPEAQQMLLDGIERNPSGVALYIDLASMLTNQGKKDEAEVIVKRLRNQLPKSSDAAIAIGDFYFEHKEADRALNEYRRGLIESPSNLDIEKRLQDLYLSTGQTQLAAGLDQELMKGAPKDVIVRIDHGRLLIAQGKLTDAIANLRKVVTDSADSALAHYFLGLAYWQNGETGQAANALQDAVRASPGLPIALQTLVRLNIAQGNLSGAQAGAQELVQRFPADPANRKLLGEALARQGNLQAAEQQLLVAKQLAPSDSSVHLDLAQVYSGEKNWPQAQDEFTAAFQLDPNNTDTIGQWVDFLVSRKQPTQALSQLRDYVGANPKDANGHVLLGTLELRLANLLTAQEELEHATQIDPTSVRAYLEIGKVYEAESRPSLAISSYEKALDLQPKSAALDTLVGNSYLRQSDLVTARKYYLKALENDPNFAVANANLAWVDAQEGKDLNSALGMAQKAKSTMPDVPSITDTLAWVMYKKGDYAGAIPLLRECIGKSPDSATFRYHLGMTLLATGQKAAGKGQLDAALRMKLGKDEAQEAQRELSQLN